jgi:ADP-ribosyl-[dinitrogen reductase] hydrolase
MIMIPERAYGVMVGAAVGDALGMPLEFGRPRRGQDQITEMIAGRLPAGTFTDDTEMGLALGASLADQGGFDAEDVTRRFIAWAEAGPADIGGQTRLALARQRRAMEQLKPIPPASAEWNSAGNGSIMRCFPTPLAYHDDLAECLRVAVAQGEITHPAPDCAAGCKMMVAFIWHALRVQDAPAALDQAISAGLAAADDMDAEFRTMLERAPERTAEELPNTGWVRHTLESAIWALSTTANYAECVIAAANLGGDADTSACVAGAMAGALYGLEGIPARWREQVRGEYPLRSGQLWREAELIALTARLIDINTTL